MNANGGCDIHLSLVIPVYNAAGFIRDNLLHAAEFLGRIPGPNELIVVDDASGDATASVVESLLPRIADLGVFALFLKNDVNRGKGHAVRRGFRVARGSLLIFNDADFTYPVEAVEAFAKHLEDGCEVVIGNRLHEDSRYEISPTFIPYLYTRHLTSRVFNWIVNAVLFLGVKDTQAGIKGFRRRAAEAIFARQSLNRFSFDLEVLFLARRLGFKVFEAPVHFFYRKEPTTIKFMRDSLHMLYDIGRIRWRALTRRYDRPLDPARK